ncbi:hypothetical protein PoB_002739700 [Plakobranchus ocellatus]|uniref:Uncharacterized protein n=1 Tax=Plakobranchus ocellatus TaxID=259542 RepID=A0AAV4A0S8_9GAST|nr:hypothetical protein PoB_002739700 [Plakobranchus ocellatus]
MLGDGMMLMLAGVYDGQRPTLNIDVLIVDVNARLRQGNPRLQGHCQLRSVARLEHTTGSFAIRVLAELGVFDATASDVILVNSIVTFVVVTTVAVGDVTRKP